MDHSTRACSTGDAKSLRKQPRLIFIAFLFLALLLSACGGPGSSSQSSGPVTLTFGWWSNDPQKDQSMRAWLDSFEKTHANIKIKSEIIPWGNYWDKVKTTTAGGNAYDLIGVCSCVTASYADKGVFLNLSQFSDYNDTIKDLQPGPLAVYNWKGNPYGLPVGVAVPMLGYNKDLFTKAGLPLPDPTKAMTFDEFKQIAKKLTVTQNGKVVQYALHPNNIIDVDTMVALEGGSTYDNYINPTKITINTPEGIQGLTDYLSLFKENIAVPYDQLSNGPWGAGDLASLQGGKVAFARIGPWNFQEIRTQSPNIAVTPLFSIKQQLVLSGANGLSIYSGSKHKQEAWEFLKWAVQTQNQVEFAKFSDVPSDKGADAQLDNILQPKEFVPTLQTALNTFKPGVMTPNQQLSTALGDIIADMVHGKLTPAQAAAQMEKQGNALLSSGS